MWIWSKSRQILDRVGDFDPDAIIAEARGRPFIVEYLNNSFPSYNLRAMFFRPRYESLDYEVFELGIDNSFNYGEDVPFHEDDRGVVHNDGFIQNHNEVWEEIESMPPQRADFVNEEGLIEMLFAHNNIDHYGDEYYNTPLLITFATEPKAYASINRWYLPKHLG